jgi:hypothetical protein
MSDGNKATIQKEGKYKGEGQERCIELSTETHAVTAQAYASPQYDSRDMASRGRLGAYALRATHDPREYTSSARKSFLARFMPIGMKRAKNDLRAEDVYSRGSWVALRA